MTDTMNTPMEMPQRARPARKLMDPQTELAWFEFAAGSSLENGHYWVRGGVCWPKLTAERGVIGAVVVCAKAMKTGLMAILAEHEFATIDPVKRRRDGGIQPFPYLAQFLTDAWADWFCNTFYRHEEPAGHHLYLMQVQESAIVEPKPAFPKVDWSDELDALTRIYALEESERLVYQEGGPFHRAFEAHQADPKAETYEPALLAMMAAVIGIDRRPSHMADEDLGLPEVFVR